MIANLVKLYGAPSNIDVRLKWKLDLVKYMILDPTDAMTHALTVTSGIRTAEQQATMDPSRAARGISQHELAEAVDFTCDDMDTVYRWMYYNVRWWQLIMYINKNVVTEIHASILSELAAIVKKALINTDGVWSTFAPQVTP